VKPPAEILRTSGWRPDLVDSDGHPDDDSMRSPARHFVGFLATDYFHPRVANTALSCNEQPGNPGASEQDVYLAGRFAPVAPPAFIDYLRRWTTVDLCSRRLAIRG